MHYFYYKKTIRILFLSLISLTFGCSKEKAEIVKKSLNLVDLQVVSDEGRVPRRLYLKVEIEGKNIERDKQLLSSLQLRIHFSKNGEERYNDLTGIEAVEGQKNLYKAFFAMNLEVDETITYKSVKLESIEYDTMSIQAVLPAMPGMVYESNTISYTSDEVQKVLGKPAIQESVSL